jgi:hypothetical protein
MGLEKLASLATMPSTASRMIFRLSPPEVTTEEAVSGHDGMTGDQDWKWV